MSSSINEVLDRRHVIPGLQASDKDSFLRQLAARAALALKLDEAAIYNALSEREKLGSTGVGGGLAIPHARIEGLEAPFGMFARAEPAIDFAAIDGRPVDLVFLLLTPSRASAAHLSILAAISRRLRDPNIAAALRKAENAKELHKLLAGTPVSGTCPQ